MQGDHLQVADWQAADWAQVLAGLMALAGCAAMAASGPKPGATLLPAAVKPAAPEPWERGDLPPEVIEFMRLPPHIRRQVMDYARNWISAGFERTG